MKSIYGTCSNTFLLFMVICITAERNDRLKNVLSSSCRLLMYLDFEVRTIFLLNVVDIFQT